MKASYYNIHFDHNDQKYIYNTLSTAIAEITPKLDSQLKNSKITEIDPEFLDALQESHFIVPKNSRESDEYLFFYDKMRYGDNARSIYLNLIPSYQCNLACPYCYEGQNKPHEIMSMDNLGIIEKFFENTIKNSNGMITQAVIRFYGGEPLLHKKHIFQFAKKTKEIANKYGIRIRYDMPSNFTIIDDEILQFIKDYNVTIQVSIDGTKDFHDKRRITKNGQGTYDQILQNLKRAKEFKASDNITIRINIDEKNIDSADECFGQLKKYAPYIYFGLLNEFSGYNDDFSKNCLSCDSYSSIMSQKLNPIAKKYGQEPVRPFGKHAPCVICTENKFFIDPELKVYKCEIIVNRDDCCVGIIDENGEFLPNENFYNQMSFTPRNFPECLECKLLPLCGGGCPAKKYINTNRTNGCFDQKNCDMTKDNLIEYLKFYVDNPADEEE